MVYASSFCCCCCCSRVTGILFTTAVPHQFTRGQQQSQQCLAMLCNDRWCGASTDPAWHLIIIQCKLVKKDTAPYTYTCTAMSLVDLCSALFTWWKQISSDFKRMIQDQFWGFQQCKQNDFLLLGDTGSGPTEEIGKGAKIEELGENPGKSASMTLQEE